MSFKEAEAVWKSQQAHKVVFDGHKALWWIDDGLWELKDGKDLPIISIKYFWKPVKCGEDEVWCLAAWYSPMECIWPKVEEIGKLVRGSKDF